jgi:hypothetical protein
VRTKTRGIDILAAGNDLITDEYIYIGPNADGLDSVDLRYVTDDGKIASHITAPPEMMLQVTRAILALSGEREPK